MPSHLVIIKELLFLSWMLIIVLLIVNEYGDFFQEFSLQKIVSVLCLFLIIWMAFGIIITKNAFKWTNKWVKAENVAVSDYKLEELKRTYKAQSQSNSLSEKTKFKANYILMRQEFIRPVTLPMLSPCQLRQDFEFSEYLSLSLKQLLIRIFTLNIDIAFTPVTKTLVFFTIILFGRIYFWFLVLISPVLIFIFMELQDKHFDSILSVLVSKETLIEKCFNRFPPDNRDPFQPKYECFISPFILAEDRDIHSLTINQINEEQKFNLPKDFEWKSTVLNQLSGTNFDQNITSLLEDEKWRLVQNSNFEDSHLDNKTNMYSKL